MNVTSGGGRAVAGLRQPRPRDEIDLYPETEPVQAWEIEAGDIVVEAYAMPAVVVEVKSANGPVYLHCRYIWESAESRTWLWGPLPQGSILQRAIAQKPVPSSRSRSEES